MVKCMHISYDYYRIFYYVAKYHSFTRAANVLMNSQPNITRSIKNLETALGCTLFVRSNRGVQLTQEGSKLYEHVRIAFEHIQAGEEALSLDKSLQEGVITIGASEVALHCFLLPILKQYHQLYPGIRIRISNDSTPQALSDLKNRLVDLAVVTMPTSIPKPLKATPVKDYQEVAVGGASFSRLANRMLPLKELAAYPIVCLRTQTTTYAFYERFFSSHQLPFAPDVEVATADQILPMVKNDLGIGFVPQAFVLGDAAQNNLFVLDLAEPIPKRTICLVKHMEQSLSIAAKELERMILDAAKQEES